MVIYHSFGIEDRDECYGGSIFSAGAVNDASSDTRCSMSCSGNRTEIYGEQSRLSSYQNKKVRPLTVSKGNPNFTYYTCVTEPSSGRALPTRLMAANELTVESCLRARSSISVGRRRVRL